MFSASFQKVMSAEAVDTRSKAMKMITLDMLSTLLKFVVGRMKYPEVKLGFVMNLDSASSLLVQLCRVLSKSVHI